MKYSRPRFWLLMNKHWRRETVPARDLRDLAGLYADDHTAWLIMRRLEERGLPVRLIWLEELPQGWTGWPGLGARNLCADRPPGLIWALYTNYFHTGTRR